ncbi:hypothetical protein [Methylomonas sp. YC3]
METGAAFFVFNVCVKINNLKLIDFGGFLEKTLLLILDLVTVGLCWSANSKAVIQPVAIAATLPLLLRH